MAEIEKCKGPLDVVMEEGDGEDDEEGTNEEETQGHQDLEEPTEVNMSTDSKSKDELSAAEDAWAAVGYGVIAGVEGKDTEPKNKTPNGANGGDIEGITFSAALHAFRIRMVAVEAEGGEREKRQKAERETPEKGEEFGGGIQSIFRDALCCLFPSSTKEGLVYSGWEEDVSLLRHLQTMPLNHADPIHRRILATISSVLGKSKQESGGSGRREGNAWMILNCPAVGAHWQKLGFQGNDPGTDLRSTGMLSLLHLLFVATHDAESSSAPTSTSPSTSFTHLIPEIRRMLIRLSQHDTRGFPLALACINFTLSVFTAVTDGTLRQIINADGDLWKVSRLLPKKKKKIPPIKEDREKYKFTFTCCDHH